MIKSRSQHSLVTNPENPLETFRQMDSFFNTCRKSCEGRKYDYTNRTSSDVKNLGGIASKMFNRKSTMPNSQSNIWTDRRCSVVLNNSQLIDNIDQKVPPLGNELKRLISKLQLDLKASNENYIYKSSLYEEVPSSGKKFKIKKNEKASTLYSWLKVNSRFKNLKDLLKWRLIEIITEVVEVNNHSA